jgi:His/Glu/Gln/Arg/opine family amino acid ABC transporter permease subunit
VTLFSWPFFVKTFVRLLGRVHITIGISLGAFAFGFILALILAAVQIYRVPVARQLARFYISFMRGTPILIQLLICNLALPGIIWRVTGFNAGRYWPTIIFVIIAYSMNIAAFVSETLRAAITGVGEGQQEAAYSVGLTRLESLWYVILPQAFRISLPGLANSLSSLLKDTSLAYSAAGILDVMGMVTVNNASNFRELEGYVGAAIIFFALCLLIERGTHLLSRHFSKGVAAIPTRGA